MKKLIESTLKRMWVPPSGTSFRGLTVYPIYPGLGWNWGDPLRQVDYIPLPDALRDSQAVISEMPTARVPELCVENRGTTALLALDGDELVGGRQNRVLNSSVLLDHGQTLVPVSCCEQGRWRETRSAHFQAGERLPHGMRASSHGHVGQNLSSHGGHHSDQRALWRDIAGGHASHGSHSDTQALNDWYEAQKEVVQAYQESFVYPKGAVGMVVALGQRIVCCDLFDRPHTAQHYWPRLVRACAPEAARSSHQIPSGSPQAILEAVKDCTLEPHPSPGLGTDVRLKSSALSGSALIFDDVLVHLSLIVATEVKK